MIPCKNCEQDTTTKNGFVRNKQRYKCQACGYNLCWVMPDTNVLQS